MMAVFYIVFNLHKKTLTKYALSKIFCLFWRIDLSTLFFLEIFQKRRYVSDIKGHRTDAIFQCVKILIFKFCTEIKSLFIFSHQMNEKRSVAFLNGLSIDWICFIINNLKTLVFVSFTKLEVFLSEFINLSICRDIRLLSKFGDVVSHRNWINIYRALCRSTSKVVSL